MTYLFNKLSSHLNFIEHVIMQISAITTNEKTWYFSSFLDFSSVSKLKKILWEVSFNIFRISRLRGKQKWKIFKKYLDFKAISD